MCKDRKVRKEGREDIIACHEGRGKRDQAARWKKKRVENQRNTIRVSSIHGNKLKKKEDAIKKKKKKGFYIKGKYHKTIRMQGDLKGRGGPKKHSTTEQTSSK